jgi:hypothetical protein
VGFGTSRKKYLLVRRRQNKILTLHNWHTNNIANCLVVRFGCNGTFSWMKFLVAMCNGITFSP